MPYSTINSSSRALVPWAKTPTSLPRPNDDAVLESRLEGAAALLERAVGVDTLACSPGCRRPTLPAPRASGRARRPSRHEREGLVGAAVAVLDGPGARPQMRGACLRGETHGRRRAGRHSSTPRRLPGSRQVHVGTFEPFGPAGSPHRASPSRRRGRSGRARPTASGRRRSLLGGRAAARNWSRTRAAPARSWRTRRWPWSPPAGAGRGCRPSLIAFWTETSAYSAPRCRGRAGAVKAGEEACPCRDR